MFGLNAFGQFSRPMDEADVAMGGGGGGMPNTYGGRITYRPVQQEGLEGQVSTRYVVDTIDGFPAAAYRVEPDGQGGLRTFNPKTGQYEQGASRVGMDFGDAGLPMLPPSIGADFGGNLLTKNAAASNRGGFFEDYALPAIIGGIATGGLAGMAGYGPMAAGSNALGTTASAGGNALLASSSPTLSGMGATGAYVPSAGIAGVDAALGTGAMGAGIDTAALNLGAAGTNAAIDAVGAAGTGAAASSLPAWIKALTPYSSLIGGAVSAGGALLGAGQISSAARDAAELSSGAADRSTALQRQMYEQNQANLAPYLAAGRNALGRIDTGMAPGGEFSKSFSMDDFTADPGYGFRMSEGLKAMDRNAAARGGLISGAALKAGTRYGQDMASQEYTNAFNRYQTNRGNQLAPLQSLAGIGQTATNNLASVGSNYASNVGNIDTNAANVRANAGLTSGAGYASAYGAVGNALNNAFNPNPVMAYLQSLNKQGVA